VTDAKLSDAELLESISKSGLALLQTAQQQLAGLPSMQDDERWSGPPIPIRFEIQLAGLFMAALDAYDVTAGILRVRASQQAFSGLRFQLETLALIRWLVESSDPRERQHRAYKIVCGLITRWGKFLLADAGREQDALDGVRAVRTWGQRLREIANQDGIPRLKEPPRRADLLSKYGHESGHPTFSMLSELGSHPGNVGNLLFAWNPESTNVSYNLEGALAARAFWTSAAIVHLRQTCEVVSSAFGWEGWLAGEPTRIYLELAPLMAEALRRYRPSLDSA
jgi:hypothetical protein